MPTGDAGMQTVARHQSLAQPILDSAPQGQ
jgi:hypothetical protein